MDSETYAKELTSEQYDRIMTPIKNSVLTGSSGLRLFQSRHQTTDKRKKKEK